MKDKANQLFRDKFVLVMLVLGLLTIVAAVGTVTIRKGNQNLEESPYLEINEPDGMIIGENETASVAGNSNATEAAEPAGASAQGHAGEIAAPVESAKTEGPETTALEAGAAAGDSLALNFTGTEKLMWPVQGNVILSYSMDTTTYFPTLEQYKCNPANVIQSDVSTPVSAPADARVLEIGNNEEIGNYVRLDLGNEYTAVCGQLKEIPVVVNEYLEKGDVIGYIAEPTKYYSVEGINLYFELQHAGEPVDALDYLE
ncbi:MAG: M23 family metallopeptidase [Lachnospiraceae bacterium]|nr:M23 family metallopeptidase [Lachnospiraceae bacterium]